MKIESEIKLKFKGYSSYFGYGLKTDQEERKKLLLIMPDAVYVDVKKSKSIVAKKPKLSFKPVFQVAASKKRFRYPYLK
jgi:hypothetical protein